MRSIVQFVARVFFNSRRFELFVFFQAEDGIRDLYVTGVQTCALPILAGKSTLNRLERTPEQLAVQERYTKIVYDAVRIEELFTDDFIRAQSSPPQEVVLDLDATDDPLHGKQEGRFFHGYYGCYCYLPLYIFCGDYLLCAKLRKSDRDGATGALEEVARIVGQLRTVWPEFSITVRADSGFARQE